MTAAALGAYIVFEDEAGFSMTPPRARTWGRRGHMAVVRVRGRSWRRWSIAAMCCYMPGESSRLIYRPRRHRKHKGKGRDTFAWSDYRDLVVRAHIQLQAPIVLIWSTTVSASGRAGAAKLSCSVTSSASGEVLAAEDEAGPSGPLQPGGLDEPVGRVRAGRRRARRLLQAAGLLFVWGAPSGSVRARAARRGCPAGGR